MKHLIRYVMVLCLLPLWMQIRAQDTLDISAYEPELANMELELITLRDNYHVILPGGLAGNILVYSDAEKTWLVDNQYKVLVPRIRELLNGVSDKPIGRVINTHFHYDHVDANRQLGGEGIPIVAHEQVREAMSAHTLLTPPFNMVQPPYPEEALPSITLKDTLSFHTGNETISLKHFNAHTGGDVVVHFQEADIWHTGDIFVTYGLPYIDEWNGGDIYGMIDAMNYILAHSGPEATIIPGHGPVCTMQEATAYRDMLVSMKDQIRTLLKEGNSLDEMIEKVSLPEGFSTNMKTEFVTHVRKMIQKHEN